MRLAQKSLVQKSRARKSLGDKLNARVAWPGLEPTADEPAAAAERTTADTALQFTTDDTNSVAAAAPRSTMGVSTAATKPARPATIAATEERKVDPMVLGTTPTASTPVQADPFDAPPPGQMRVIMPAPNSDPVAAPNPSDPPPARSSSSPAQTLATLAGAISAGIVAWLMMGSRRIARSRQV